MLKCSVKSSQSVTQWNAESFTKINYQFNSSIKDNVCLSGLNGGNSPAMVSGEVLTVASSVVLRRRLWGDSAGRAPPNVQHRMTPVLGETVFWWFGKLARFPPHLARFYSRQQSFTRWTGTPIPWHLGKFDYFPPQLARLLCTAMVNPTATIAFTPPVVWIRPFPQCSGKFDHFPPLSLITVPWFSYTTLIQKCSVLWAYWI